MTAAISPGLLYRAQESYLSMKRADVKGRRFTVVLRQEDVSGYSVRCVEIPAAISQGETRSEALKNIKEAIGLYLEAFPDESKIIEELGRVTGKKEMVEVTV
jgi:predicted RNase H-like HicB family nuclease